MSTDRELLELAAKAAGFTTRHSWNAERLQLAPPVLAMVVHQNGELVTTGWDPLSNDGDAMRLAVKLCFSEHGHQFADVFSNLVDQAISELAVVDPYAATRRSIVQAAADIGKAMP